MPLRKKPAKENYDYLDFLQKEISETDLNKFKLCDVPSIEEHIRLHGRNIASFIIDAYNEKGHMPDKQESNKKFWQNLHNNEFFPPYHIKVYGSYPPMRAWKTLQHYINLGYYPDEKYNYLEKDFTLYKKEFVLELLKKFAEGFQFGFDNFVKDKVNTANSFISSDSQKIQRILDFLLWSSHLSWNFNLIGIQTEDEINWYNNGVNTGYDYCAWYMIFQHHKSFEPHFKSVERKRLKEDKLIENRDKEVFSFVLLAKISTLDCFNSLINNKFINPTTKKTQFDRIFSGEIIENKVDWISTLPELARFVFLLHSGEKESNLPAVCVKAKKLNVIASQCFTLNRQEILPSAFQNNNREFKYKRRKGFIIKAIKHLLLQQKQTM